MRHNSPHVAANLKVSDLVMGLATPEERFHAVFGGGQPVLVHPLNLEDAARSAARLADIELGLTAPSDAWYWRNLAEVRLQLLECDRDHYGLVPHEELEVEQLKALLA